MTGNLLRGGRSALGRVLREKKRSGAQVLITGDVSGDVIDENCKRLLGAPDASPPRRRVIVGVGRTPDIAIRRLPVDVGPLEKSERTEFVHGSSLAEPARGVSPDGGVIPGEGAAPRAVVTATSLADGLVDAVERVQTDGRGFEPGELRVSIDSLGTFKTTKERLAVIELVQDRVVEPHAALVHWVYDTAFDDVRVCELHGAVDLVLEYDDTPAGIQQRVVVPGEDYRSEWWTK